MEDLNHIDVEPFSINRDPTVFQDRLEIMEIRDPSKSVDWYEVFCSPYVAEDDFEAKIDDDLINNSERRDSLKSSVFAKFKKQGSAITSSSKRRVSVRRQRKKLKDFCGYLLKKSGSIFKGWQKRFVHLSESRIWYYKERGDLTPLGIINLELVDAKVKITK